MPLNRNKTGRFMLIEALPLLHLAVTRYTRFRKAIKDNCSLTFDQSKFVT